MNEQHDRSIITAIKKMAGTFSTQTFALTTGKVISVDLTARTCVVEMDNYTDMTCRLMAQVGDGMLLNPTVGSTVAVLFATYTDAYVIMCSDVDTISFKGTELGGLVKVIDLTEKLNNLENKVNDILTNFNSHTHIVISVGSPTAPTTSIISGTLTPTQQADIENKNVLHGN